MANGIRTGDPVVSIKDVVRSSVKVLEFDKHLKARGHIGRNVVEITIKMKTIVRKTLMIKKRLDEVIISCFSLYFDSISCCNIDFQVVVG